VAGNVEFKTKACRTSRQGLRKGDSVTVMTKKPRKGTWILATREHFQTDLSGGLTQRHEATKEEITEWSCLCDFVWERNSQICCV